jgi:hypothetical protein
MSIEDPGDEALEKEKRGRSSLLIYGEWPALLENVRVRADPNLLHLRVPFTDEIQCSVARNGAAD